MLTSAIILVPLTYLVTGAIIDLNEEKKMVLNMTVELKEKDPIFTLSPEKEETLKEMKKVADQKYKNMKSISRDELAFLGSYNDFDNYHWRKLEELFFLQFNLSEYENDKVFIEVTKEENFVRNLFYHGNEILNREHLNLEEKCKKMHILVQLFNKSGPLQINEYLESRKMVTVN